MRTATRAASAALALWLTLAAAGALAVGAPSGPPSEGIAAPAASAPEDDLVAVPEPDAKALAYYRSGNLLWWLGQAFGLAFPLLLLATGFSARMRDGAARVAKHWLATAALYAVFYRALDWLASTATVAVTASLTSERVNPRIPDQLTLEPDAPLDLPGRPAGVPVHQLRN